MITNETLFDIAQGVVDAKWDKYNGGKTNYHPGSYCKKLTRIRWHALRESPEDTRQRLLNFISQGAPRVSLQLTKQEAYNG